MVCAGRGGHISSHTALQAERRHAPRDMPRPPYYVTPTPAPPSIAPPGVDSAAAQQLPPASLAAVAPLTMTIPPPCHLPPPGIPLGPPPRPHIHLPALPPAPSIPAILPPGLGAPAVPMTTHRAAAIIAAGPVPPAYPLTGDPTHSLVDTF